MSDEPKTALNTDRELFRESTGEPAGAYYENIVFVTADGRIGMSVGGSAYVASIKEWHLEFGAARYSTGLIDGRARGYEAGYEAGYRDGESSRDADWRFQLSEAGGIPDEVMRGSLYEICLWIDQHVPDYFKTSQE